MNLTDEQRPPVWSHHKQANNAGKNIEKYFQEVKANSIRFNTEGDQDNPYKLSFLSVIGCTSPWSVKTCINYQSHLLLTFPFIFPFLFILQLMMVKTREDILDSYSTKTGVMIKCFGSMKWKGVEVLFIIDWTVSTYADTLRTICRRVKTIHVYCMCA